MLVDIDNAFLKSGIMSFLLWVAEVNFVCRRGTTTTICNEFGIENYPRMLWVRYPRRTSMDIGKLSLKESWFSSEECKKLTEYVKDLLKKDDLSPCDIEVINNDIPDEHQEVFWERIMEYFDRL